MRRVILVNLIATAALIALSGCTDIKPLQADINSLKSQVGKLQSDVSSVKASADAATRAANSAQSAAAQAAQAASRAQSTASQALTASQAARAGADQLNEKVDRMFTMHAPKGGKPVPTAHHKHKPK